MNGVTNIPRLVFQDLEATQMKPDPTFETRGRRTFSADYKLRIVQQADTCVHGELGALLLE